MKAAMHDPQRAAKVNRLKSSSHAARLPNSRRTRLINASENPQGRFERRSGTVIGVVANDNAA